MTLEKMLKKAQAAKSMAVALAVALDTADEYGMEAGEFAPALNQVNEMLAEITESMEAALESRHLDFVE